MLDVFCRCSWLVAERTWLLLLKLHLIAITSCCLLAGMEARDARPGHLNVRRRRSMTRAGLDGRRYADVLEQPVDSRHLSIENCHGLFKLAAQNPTRTDN
jgi:hypothetical protein